MSIGVGFVLQPDDAFLSLTVEVAARADYLEVTPESLWTEREDGAFASNGFHSRFLAARRAMQKPFVAHGVAYGLGSTAIADAPRRERWRARMREDHTRFRFEWWTDHAGATTLGGQNVALPVAVPPGEASERVLSERLLEMRTVVPVVGAENSALYFVLGDPLDDATTLARGLARADAHLLLDLHNLHTNAENLGFEPDAWLARMDLTRVIEIHVSGGSPSDPAWLPSGHVMRLDAHDSAVPEPVWALLERVLPQCPNVRGVTLERMDGTVQDDHEADAIMDEMIRIRAAVEAAS